MKVSRSLKSFEHKQVTPVLKTIFGEASIGVESSGIDLLFPSVRRGRPRPTAGLSLRREIANIVCQARDIKTSKLHVLVRWADESVAARWLPLDHLNSKLVSGGSRNLSGDPIHDGRCNSNARNSLHLFFR